MSFTYRDNTLYCDNVAVDAIADEAGTPLYIYSASRLRERYRAIAQAFAGIDTTVCFSVKSCSSLGVLNVLRQEGCSFDVVSGGELHRVLKAGGNPARVVYAGVGKTASEIRYALEHGILMFNVESEAELVAINAVAGEMGKIAPVALRLNPDVDPKTHRYTTTGKKESKFGLDFERAGGIVDNLSRYPHVSLRGLHVHIGSPVNDPEPYGAALDKVAAFMARHASGCAAVEYINSGGGFGLLYNQESVPPFSAYAEVIVPRVKELGKKLIIEPGRSIAGDAGVLLATVQYAKTNGEKTWYITDGAMNDLIRPALYEAWHPIWPTSGHTPPPWQAPVGEEHLTACDIVGPVCESSDFFAKDRPLPAMKQGERLAVFCAGAYGFTMSSTYNSRPRAAEVLVDDDTWRVIRRRETWDDLTAAETV